MTTTEQNAQTTREGLISTLESHEISATGNVSAAGAILKAIAALTNDPHIKALAKHGELLMLEASDDMDAMRESLVAAFDNRATSH